MSRIDNIISRFPDFYQSEETENLFYKYIAVFATLLDEAEEDMLGIMRTHWVKKADNAGSKGFDAKDKGDLDKIFALYLESLGGTALLKQGDRHADTEGGKTDDDLYRSRVLSVINVFKNGAATKQGITDIIAANLGIAQDIPFADEAKESIRIVEFLPQLVANTLGGGGVRGINTQNVVLYTSFKVTNTSVTAAIPEFQFQLNDKNTPTTVAIPVLFNLRVVNTVTGDFIKYNEEVKAGDSLSFLSNGTGLLNGVEFIPTGRIILPSGESTLRVEAELGLPAGRFDQNTLFDFALFDVRKIRPIGRFDRGFKFDESVFNYEKSFATLDIQYLKLTPGAFTAVVPWDIPGFSVTIKITDYTLNRLKVFGVPPNQIDAIGKLKGTEYETIAAFYKDLHLELHKIMPEIPEVAGKEKDTEGVRALKKLIIRESELKDKYARQNISPRGQLAAIINRVKAAGVYAEVNFEKRFAEYHELTEKAYQEWDWHFKAENQDMKEISFQKASIQNNTVQHEMTDTLRLSGVFDYTRFDSLNRFAATPQNSDGV